MQRIRTIAVAAVLICGAVLCALILLAGRARAFDDKAMERTDDYTFSRCLRGVEPPEREPKPVELEPAYTEEDVAMIARLIYAEARGIPSKMEQAAVAWCVINRVADPRWPDTIAGVVTQRAQFAYRPNAPILPELEELARDVLDRWSAELAGVEDVGRVLPMEFVFFAGDGRHNYFRSAHRGGTVWDWNCFNPYGEAAE